MIRYYFSAMLFFAALFPCTTVASGTLVSSSKAACKVLIQVALSKRLTANPTPKGQYYCEPEGANETYFVVGLHYKFQAPKDWAGSNLAGWYAIIKSDGRVYQWDVATQQLGDIVAPP